MSDYVPNWGSAQELYALGADTFNGTRRRQERREEFDRFIAKIKADALREAATVFGPGQMTGLFRSPYDYASIWLTERADRIEEEA